MRGRTALLWNPMETLGPFQSFLSFGAAGAKLLNQQLSVWTASWRCHFDSGGIAGTSSDTALQQLSRELRMGAQLAVQQDVSSFSTHWNTGSRPECFATCGRPNA